MTDPAADPATTTAPATPAAPAVPQHCWDPILDSGGTVAVFVPIDPSQAPFRAISVTREEQMFVRYKCCLCSVHATRRFKIAPNLEDHGPHHVAYDLPEVESLPDGPCSGAQQ